MLRVRFSSAALTESGRCRDWLWPLLRAPHRRALECVGKRSPGKMAAGRASANRAAKSPVRPSGATGGSTARMSAVSVPFDGSADGSAFCFVRSLELRSSVALVVDQGHRRSCSTRTPTPCCRRVHHQADDRAGGPWMPSSRWTTIHDHPGRRGHRKDIALAWRWATLTVATY